MAKFIKNLFLQTLSIVLASSILFFGGILFIALFSGGVAKVTQGGGVEPDSVLFLRLDHEITERGSDFGFDGIPYLDMERSMGLYDIVDAIQKAKEDKNIKGIYLRVRHVSGGWATAEALRNALIDFQKSKKFLIAYSDRFTEKSYYIASAASRVYLYPGSSLNIDGFALTPVFFKGLLEKLEVRTEIFRVGTHKAAVEPFIRKSMSEENRKQTRLLINGLWKHFKKKIGENRKLKVSIDEVAKGHPTLTAKEALGLGFVDALQSDSETRNEIRKKLKLKDDKKIPFVLLKNYVRHQKVMREIKSHEDKVAVIFSTGEMHIGKNEENHIMGSDSITAYLREAMDDKKVKAIVMRINSPGGDAIAADVIWKQIEAVKKKKPVVISMGDMAASGGYYMAAGGSYVFAEPTTITGSIGVFGIHLETDTFFKKKVGLSFDRVVTHPYADMGNSNRKITQFEKAEIQRSVENIYERFTGVVVKGRKKNLKAKIDKIAQGRVWLGEQALNLGLVDAFGGLDMAIYKAAMLAKISDYDVEFMPGKKEPFEWIVSNFMGQVKEWWSPSTRYGEVYKDLKRLERLNGVMTLYPYQMVVE